MNRSLAALAAFVFVSAAHAGEINRCVAPSGKLTLTDAPCPADAQPAIKAAPAVRSAREQRVLMTGASAKRDLPAAQASVTHGLARDVVTLKLAHQTMQLLDNSAAAMRQQRVAAR